MASKSTMKASVAFRTPYLPKSSQMHTLCVSTVQRAKIDREQPRTRACSAPASETLHVVRTCAASQVNDTSTDTHNVRSHLLLTGFFLYVGTPRESVHRSEFVVWVQHTSSAHEDTQVDPVILGYFGLIGAMFKMICPSQSTRMRTHLKIIDL